MSTDYVSVFKIDGVPILPPVMTKERREEMRLLRELAIKVEERLSAERKNRLEDPPANYPEEILPEPVPPEDFDETATSETLPTDVAVDQVDQQNLILEVHEMEARKQFPSPVPQLIRSNSYTLDQPSPLLLKFLDSVVAEANAKRKTESKSPKKRLNNAKTNKSLKNPSPGTAGRKKTPTKPLHNNHHISPLRKSKSESLNDTKRRLKIHSEGEKVEKFFMKSKTVKDFENLTQKATKDEKDERKMAEKQNLTSREENSIDESTLKENEPNLSGKDGKDDMEEVVEQKIPEMESQREIIQQMNSLHLVEINRTSTPLQLTPSIGDVAEDHSVQSEDCPLNDTSFYWTIDRQSPINCSMSLVSDAYSKQYLHSLRQFSSTITSPPPLSQSVRSRENEEIAATIINSFVRGYLIRRLLRSEFVQNIIESIKHVLFLILDSHPRDLQLKRTYLVQLEGHCAKLHDVFFAYSTKERMAVIRKDREMLLQRINQKRKKLRGTLLVGQKD